ncbi:DUF4194 domain-containing protein [Ectothiorhodospira lacustris]|uniref:DUF4194 domain-containing protein n=1 Tax=Ectothiorhodospira lacustris TaxID=2899127 RepID=UPI001EE805C5|nr:DUF4194 domain-containing protein [Ectothiorhodospira lacustris]MCG5501769.1 DUF4194 domain-containing protein [Ectothiorhodospira lacustris]
MTDIETDSTFSAMLITLFRGVLYKDQQPRHWQVLQDHQARVRDHVAVLGLELMLDDAEGHACLRQRPTQDDETELPRLVQRRQLSYPVSLLLALLRKKLVEHDAGGGDPRLILSREQMVEMLRVFLPPTANEARLVDRIQTDINKVVELGFLRRLRGQEDQYEVRRIIKTFIDAQWLAEFDQRLTEYRNHAGEADDGT